MIPFSWQGQKLCGLSLVFIKDWRVVTHTKKVHYDIVNMKISLVAVPQSVALLLSQIAVRVECLLTAPTPARVDEVPFLDAGDAVEVFPVPHSTQAALGGHWLDPKLNNFPPGRQNWQSGDRSGLDTTTIFRFFVKTIKTEVLQTPSATN